MIWLEIWEQKDIYVIILIAASFDRILIKRMREKGVFEKEVVLQIWTRKEASSRLLLLLSSRENEANTTESLCTYPSKYQAYRTSLPLLISVYNQPWIGGWIASYARQMDDHVGSQQTATSLTLHIPALTSSIVNRTVWRFSIAEWKLTRTLGSAPLQQSTPTTTIRSRVRTLSSANCFHQLSNNANTVSW